MRILGLLLVFFGLIFASQSQEFYQKALQYEKAGDVQNAMKFYKMAYENKAQDQLASSLVSKEATLAQGINKEYQSKPQSTQNADENDLSLGIKTYELNYLLPFTYTKNTPSDERKKFETKFQFSVQKPIFYDIFGFKEMLSVAYSQTSWWQTSRDSTPFRESNYRPEIFLSAPVNFGFEPLKSLKIGFIHESNGLGGDKSRSWNRAYVSADVAFGELLITPRAWVVVGRINDNEDIREYRGNADINVRYKLGGHILSAMLRSNLHLDSTLRGSVELGWNFPLFSGIYGYLNYFNGYGDSLIDYDRHINRIGLGVSVLK